MLWVWILYCPLNFRLSRSKSHRGILASPTLSAVVVGIFVVVIIVLSIIVVVGVFIVVVIVLYIVAVVVVIVYVHMLNVYIQCVHSCFGFGFVNSSVSSI